MAQPAHPPASAAYAEFGRPPEGDWLVAVARIAGRAGLAPHTDFLARAYAEYLSPAEAWAALQRR